MDNVNLYSAPWSLWRRQGAASRLSVPGGTRLLCVTARGRFQSCQCPVMAVWALSSRYRRLPKRRPGRKGGEEGVGRTPPSSAEGAGRAGEGGGSSGEMKACGKPAGLCVEWTLASGSWTLRRWEERVTFSSCEVSLPHCAPKGGRFLIQTEASSSLQRPDGGWPGLSSWAVGNAERKTGPRVAGMTRQERQP